MIRNAIVILNWNGKRHLEAFLETLIRSIGQDPKVSNDGREAAGERFDQVIVADSGSEDGSMEYLEEFFPNVVRLPLGKNYGFAGGYNVALDKVEAEYYILMNTDIEVGEGWLEPLVEWMEYHDDCGICAPKLLSYNDKASFEYAGAAGGYLDRYGFPFCRGRVMGNIEKDEGQYDMPVDVMWATGACMMIRASLFHELSGFDKGFFAHMEEIDLCWRARLLGYKVSVVPRSVVYHIGGGSLPNNSPFKLYLNYRNNLLMLRKNLPQMLALDYFFNLSAELEPIDMYSPDPFIGAKSVYDGNDRVFKAALLKQICTVAQNKASILIFTRQIIDGLSAIAYLFTGKWKNVKAVWNAHKDYRKMSANIKTPSLYNWLKSCINDPKFRTAKINLVYDEEADNLGHGPFKLRGIWSKSIIWQSSFHKKMMFKMIDENVK